MLFSGKMSFLDRLHSCSTQVQHEKYARSKHGNNIESLTQVYTNPLQQG